MIIYGIILPIDELIFFKMVIAPPTRYCFGGFHSQLSLGFVLLPAGWHHANATWSELVVQPLEKEGAEDAEVWWNFIENVLFGWNMFFGICRYALSLCIFLCTHIMINVYNYIYVDIHGRYVCIYIYDIYIYIYIFIFIYMYTYVSKYVDILRYDHGRVVLPEWGDGKMWINLCS